MKCSDRVLPIASERVLACDLRPSDALLGKSPANTGRFSRPSGRGFWRLALVGWLVLGCVGELLAKVPPEWTVLGDRPGDRLLADYFRLETKKLADACLTDITSLDQWKERRDVYHRQFRQMLGLEPMPPRTDLKPVITGQVEAEDIVVEKLHFQSLPGLYVTGNLYRAKEVKEPLPAVLYVCGHGGVKKGKISYGNKCHYQHHGVWFARHGYICLIIDTIQLGEIEGIHHGTYREGMWWWNSYGYTPAGVEAWNCVRALDYLQSRKEVDPKRLGVTGRSGGGAYSWWIAALDERIQAAVPVAGITDLQNHVVDGCVEGHCDCMYLVNTYQWDYPMIAALIAPRPLLLGNTDDDNIFPLDGVDRLFEKVRRIYRLYGAEDKFEKAIFPGGHQDLPELQKAAFAFFDKHLKGAERDPGEVGKKLFEPEQLKVFQELPTDQINTTIQESFVPLAPAASPPDSNEAWRRQTTQWMDALQEKTFRAWPKSPPPLQVQLAWRAEAAGLQAAQYEWTSQEAVRLPMVVLQKSAQDAVQPAQVKGALFVLLADQAQWQSFLQRLPEELARRLDPELAKTKEAEEPKSKEPSAKETAGEKAGPPAKQTPPAKKESVQKPAVPSGPTGPVLPPEVWETAFRALEGGQTLVLFAPRGVGPTAFNPSERKQVQVRRRFMLLGQTLEGMQLWDVRRAIQAARTLPELQNAPWRWMGRGDGAGMLIYAALWEPAPDRLLLYQPPASHRDGLGLLNVRRIWDMPEALAAAACRTNIQLHTTKPEMAQWARQVLQRLGLEANRLEVLRLPE